MRGVLEDLAALGWVIVCSTHAPEFILSSSKQKITRMWRHGEKVNKGSLLTENVKEGAKFQERLDERENHEMLFSNKVVFCERKDDFYALRLFMEKSNIDMDGKSISIIDIGGIQNMVDYAIMARDLGIPWCALTDEDKDNSGITNPNSEKVRKNFKDISSGNDSTPHWYGKLELCLGLNFDDKASPDWQRHNIEQKSLNEIETLYPNYQKTCQEVIDWINQDTL